MFCMWQQPRYAHLSLCCAGKLSTTAVGADAAAHCLHLNMAVNQLRFIKQYRAAISDIDNMLMDHAAGEGLQDAIAGVVARLPTFEIQLKRAKTHAGIISSATSNIALRGVCQVMEASVQELENNLQDMCSTGQDQQQHVAAQAISDLVASLKQQLQAFNLDPAEIQQARQELTRHLVLTLQTDIEGQLSSLRKWQHAITQKATTCKQRTHLRQKLSQGDKALAKMVDSYNKLVGSLHGNYQPEQADLARLKAGEVPWQFDGAEDGPAAVPLEDRIAICHQWQWVQRCREGEGILLHAMHNFVHYYQAMHAELGEACALSAEEAPLAEEAPPAELQPAETAAAPALLRPGLQALYRRGIAFCQRQLQTAESFVTATNGRFQMPDAADGIAAAAVAGCKPVLQDAAVLVACLPNRG
jgi:hypothetical protein